MKKRILSLFLALMMCLTLLPTAAFAEDGAQDQAEAGEETLIPASGETEEPAPAEQEGEPELAVYAASTEHTHFLCGGDTCNEVGGHSEEEYTTFTEWTDATDLPDQPGNYYLSTNVTLSGGWTPKDGTVLCLNGKTIKINGSAIKVVGENGVAWDDPTGLDEKSVSRNFTLCDCKGGGKITRPSVNGYTRCVEVNSGTFNLYGGDINNGYVPTSGAFINYGGCVLVYSTHETYLDKNGACEPITGTFNMYGGSITEGTAVFGGGVSVCSNADFNMYDGMISGNWAGGAEGYGGGVYVYGGTFNMSGGSIAKNETVYAGGVGEGGGVYVHSGTFNMSGGSITGGDTDKTVFKQGGGVYVYGGAFNMSGGTISGNKARREGGGVYVDDSGTFTISGNVNITGNTVGGATVATATTTNNVSGQITVGGNLGTSARIGVTVANAAEGAVIANVADDVTLTDSEAAKFFSDDGKYEGKLSEGSVVLGTKSAHTHYLCGDKDACTEVGGHEEDSAANFTKELTQSPSGALLLNGQVIEVTNYAYYALPAGNYYLGTDLNLKYSLFITKGTVKLCLNGRSITLEDHGYVIEVSKGCTFTLADCKGTSGEYGKITHGTDSNGTKYMRPGIYVIGTFNMYGGSISGNRSQDCSGVLFDNGSYNGGTGTVFNMYGGEITGNTSTYAGSGVYVFNNNTFNLYGGSITGNTGGSGSVYVSGGTFTVSGDVTITGNTGGNVQLPQGKTVTIGAGGLDKNARIGVTYGGTINSGEHLTVATGAANGCTADNFSADKGAPYVIQVEGDNVNLYNGLPHEHPICGKTCEDGEHLDDLTWQPLTYSNGYLYCGGSSVWTTGTTTTYYSLPAGNYYLPESITIKYPIMITGNVNLCLNGNTLSTDRAKTSETDYTPFIAVQQNDTLTLCDCDSESKGTIKTDNKLHYGVQTYYSTKYGEKAGNFTMYGGTITNVVRGVRVAGKEYSQQSTFKMYGGKITGTTCAVYVGDGSIFELYGGEITGNKAISSTTDQEVNYGIGVYVNKDAMFTMSGDAVISNNKAYKGGGVYLDTDATFTMSGNAAISNNTANSGAGVYVNGGTLTMSGDTTVSNNTATDNCGGGVYVTGGGSSFAMSGNSTISGNTAKKWGGGVYVESNGTFTMESGTISGNNVIGAASGLYGSGGGVFVNNATFNMTGGRITGNNVTLGDNAGSAEGGGGVHVARNATMNVSDSVQITDNWKNGTKNADGVYENGSANNLYLFGDDDTNIAYNVQKTVTISGDLTGAKIGVTTCLTPTANNPIQIATGATNDLSYYTPIFTPDVSDKGYMITQKGTDLYLSTHQHSWEYAVSADYATILATCKDTTCTSKNGGMVTISKPEHTVYGDGKTADATAAMYDWIAGEVSSITYKKYTGDDTSLSAAPTNAGKYIASITVGGKTAYVTYEIKKATPTASDFTFTAPNDLTYDGETKDPRIDSKIGGVIVYQSYCNEKGEQVDPINAGTYTVKIRVTGNNNYNSVDELTDPNWKFTIATNNATPSVKLSGDMIYKKQQIQPTVVVTSGGITLKEGADYTVTYGANLNAGKGNGSVTIKAKGNYGFATVVEKFDITAQIIQVTAQNKSSRVGQDLVPLTYTYTKGLPYAGDTFSGELTTTAKKDQAGTYEITQGTLTLGDNYAIRFTQGTYTVEAKSAQANFAFAETTKTVTYGDADFTLAATGEVKGSTVTYFSGDKTVATIDNNGKVHILKAGTTKIRATASATDDYSEATAEYTLTVTPKTLTKDDLEATGSLTKTYDGTKTASDVGARVKHGVLVGNDTLNITGSAEYNSKDAATANTIIFTPDAITEGNYRLAGTEKLTITTGVKINKRTITIRSVAAEPKQYDGDNKAWSCITGVTFNNLVAGDTLVKGADYGITAATFNSANVLDAKEITGTVGITNPNLNYTFADAEGNETGTAQFKVPCTITPANSWAQEPVNLTIRYSNRDEQTYQTVWSSLPTNQKWTYNLEDTKTTGSAALASHSIGADSGVLSYQLSASAENDTVTWTITASCSNYQTFTLTVTLKLIARDQQTNFRFENDTTSVTKTYGDADFTVKAIGAATGSKVTYESTDPAVSTVDENGKVTIQGAGQAVIKAKAAATPDFETKEISYTLMVNKLRIPVPTAGTNQLVYNGEEQTYLPVIEEAYTAYCEITGNKATNVYAGGSYTAQVRLNNSNVEWADGTVEAKAYPFQITPAPATVKVLDKQITAGEPAPALSDADYTVTGLCGGDTLSVALYYADPADLSTAVTPDTSKAGTYTIVAGLGATRDPNYDVTFQNGTLTIANRPSSGGAATYPVSIPEQGERGSVSSNVKNAAKGSTVTITVKPEDGFTLADLVVTDKNGNRLEITDQGNGKYTFVMPASKVEIKAAFAAEVETSPFSDVPTDAYYYEAVQWAAEQGITGGVGNGLFGPDRPCTRAQIVTFLWRAAGSPEPAALSAFTDVPVDSYYAKAVAWAVENGITTGTGDGKFSPEAPCTRAQSVTFLARAKNAQSTGSAAFSDVPADSYYAAAVAWAVENGVTQGAGEGIFAPNALCTRAQIVTFLYRASRCAGRPSERKTPTPDGVGVLYFIWIKG